MTMEFSFLYAIPRTAVLDGFFLAVTKIAGSYGQLWVIVAAVLLIFKSARKAGVAVLLANWITGRIRKIYVAKKRNGGLNQ